MSVSRGLQYGKMPVATFSTKYRNTIPPFNGSSFDPGQTIKLSIPCGTPQEFLNCRQSFLKLTVNNSSTDTALVLDGSAHAAISEVSVYYGGTLLEHIENYGGLHSALFDATADSTRGTNTGAITEGMGTGRAGASIAFGKSQEFCLGLMLGTCGINQSRYLPLQDMTLGHLEVHIKLASAPQIQEAAAEAAVAWKVDAVSFNAETLVLNSEVAREISRMNSSMGGYTIPFSSWRSQSAVLPTGATSTRLLITDNCKSLKTVVSAFHDSDSSTKYAEPWVTGRLNPFSATRYSWSYSILGQRAPRTPVSSDAESFMELQKAFHALSSASQHGRITSSTWTASEGSFMLAQCVEPMTHASTLSQSGVDISTSPMYLEAEFGALAATVTVWNYLHFDGELMVTPTGVYSVY